MVLMQLAAALPRLLGAPSPDVPPGARLLADRAAHAAALARLAPDHADVAGWMLRVQGAAEADFRACFLDLVACRSAHVALARRRWRLGRFALPAGIHPEREEDGREFNVAEAAFQDRGTAVWAWATSSRVFWNPVWCQKG
jgi:hypothetical protein